MINTFSHLVRSKDQLAKAQKAFKESLNQTYPNLEVEDTSVLLKDIGEELDLLLSSAVIYKTGRVEIPAKTGWKSSVVLTRKPGLKRPYESYPVIEFHENISEITKEGDLKFPDGREDYFIELSCLKKNKKIEQKKLGRFYFFLDRLLKIKAVAEDFLVDYYRAGDNERKVKVGSYEIVPLHRHFVIGGQVLKGENKHWETWESNEMFSFSEEKTWGRRFSLSAQLAMIEDFPKIHEALLLLDYQKGLVLDVLKKLLKELKEENKPFRILEQLTK